MFKDESSWESVSQSSGLWGGKLFAWNLHLMKGLRVVCYNVPTRLTALGKGFDYNTVFFSLWWFQLNKTHWHDNFDFTSIFSYWVLHLFLLRGKSNLFSLMFILILSSFILLSTTIFVICFKTEHLQFLSETEN